MAGVWSWWSSSERPIAWAIVSAPVLAPVLALALALAGSAVIAQERAGSAAAGAIAREDPTKIRTAEACGECHTAEHRVWQGTPHARGFKTLHRQESAQAIAESMGIRLLKRDSLCLRCHYTPALDDGELKAVSGVSCESCHGAARDWIDVHNDYGQGVDQAAAESPEHRAERIARSRAAGMRRPSDDLYAVAASCYGCHTVPEERLVNVGRHGTGSAGFELAAWSQGEIRHNFLDSFLTGDGTVNAERAPPRLRKMYVLGRALDLEYSLRGMAAATESGTYAKAMSRRLRGALGEVRAIAARADLPEIAEMIEAVRAVKAVPGNGPALLGAAEAVGAAARKFLAARDGQALAAIDPLRLGTAEAIAESEDSGEAGAGAGVAVAAGTSTDTPPVATGAGAAVAPGGGGAVTGAAGQARPAAGAPAAKAVQAFGAVKQRIRPASRHETLGPATCGGCHRHRDQNAWWLDDPHGLAVDPFFDQAPANVKIARLYGIKPAAMTRGDAICMDCHGTVVSGRERREVQDGVGCESCHGAAGDYLDPHQEGDPSLGDQRPGYVQAMKLGMVELEDLAALAGTCTGCHFVTDPRLISAGHPSGQGFDYAGGVKEIRHWQHPDPTPGALKTAFAAALAKRGSVPDVPRARLASAGGAGGAAAGPALGGTVAGGDSTASRATLSSAGRPSRPRPPRPRPVDPRSVPAPGEVAPLALPSAPEVDAGAPIEEVLRRLKARLEALYRAVERGDTGSGTGGGAP